MISFNGVWNLPQSFYDIDPNLAVDIRKVVIPFSGDAVDHLIWPNLDSGILNLKESFKFLNPPAAVSKLFKMVWCSKTPPSKSFVSWKLLQNRMPMDDCLRARGCIVVSRCDLSMKTEESAEHLFLS